MYGAFDLGREIIVGDIHFVGRNRRVAGYGTPKMSEPLFGLNGNRPAYPMVMQALRDLPWKRCEVVVPAGVSWWPVADETYGDWINYVFPKNGGRVLI